MEKNEALKIFIETFLGGVDDDMAAHFESISFCKELGWGDHLFMAGDPGESVFYMISGQLRLYRVSEEGKESVVRFVESHDLFAEVVLTGAKQYPVTASALKNSVVLGISAAGLYEMIRQEPEFACKVIGVLSTRLKYLIELVDNRAMADVKNRLLRYLEHLAEQADNRTVKLPVPKGELALLLGTTPESLSRTLRQLATDNVIKVQGSLIQLL